MWFLSRQLLHWTGRIQMLAVYLQLPPHLVNSCVCCGRSSTCGSPACLQYDYFPWNSQWTHILCQCYIYHSINKPPKLLHSSNTLSLHSYARSGHWIREDQILVCNVQDNQRTEGCVMRMRWVRGRPGTGRT